MRSYNERIIGATYCQGFYAEGVINDQKMVDSESALRRLLFGISPDGECYDRFGQERSTVVEELPYCH
jgi:hypothetical protein